MVKLIGAARLIDGRVSVRVFPALLPKDHPLAAISGSNNAVFLQGSAIGEIMLMGPGAGGVPTATAVVSDIVSIANTKDVGFLQSCSCYRSLGLFPADDVESAFFIKINVHRPGGRSCSDRRRVRRFGRVDSQHDPEGQGRRGRTGVDHSPHQGKRLLRGHRADEELMCCRNEPMTLRVL